MKLTPKKVLSRIKKEKETTEVMPTGFAKLDSKLLDGGFYKGEIIVIGAFTGVGKSLLAGQILFNIAKAGFKTAYFSLEISNEMIVARMLARLADIKATRIRFGLLTKKEMKRKIKAEAELIALNKYIALYDDIYYIDELEREILKGEYEFVVIDFIQNIISKTSSDEYTKLSNAVVRLQKVAKKTKTTILILSQLSNFAAKAGGGEKILTYKGSGAIAMVADLGFFLEKDSADVRNVDDTYNPEEGTLLYLKKNRRGLSGWYLKLGYKLPGGDIYEKQI